MLHAHDETCQRGVTKLVSGGTRQATCRQLNQLFVEIAEYGEYGVDHIAEYGVDRGIKLRGMLIIATVVEEQRAHCGKMPGNRDAVGEGRASRDGEIQGQGVHGVSFVGWLGANLAAPRKKSQGSCQISINHEKERHNKNTHRERMVASTIRRVMMKFIAWLRVVGGESCGPQGKSRKGRAKSQRSTNEASSHKPSFSTEPAGSKSRASRQPPAGSAKTGEDRHEADRKTRSQ